VIGAFVVFVAVNDAMSPIPLALSPIAVLSFVQLYVAPATAPVKLTAVVVASAQSAWSATEATVGVGLTVISNDSVAPAQPLADGVTVTVAVICALVVLVAVNDAI